MGLLDTLVERGRNESRQETLRATLTRQLELKFGVLPERARTRLSAMGDAALDRALERVLTATRLEEVLLTG